MILNYDEIDEAKYLAGAIAMTVAGLAVEAWRATNPERNAR